MSIHFDEDYFPDYGGAYGTDNMPDNEFVVYWADTAIDDFCDCPECKRWFRIVDGISREREKIGLEDPFRKDLRIKSEDHDEKCHENC